MRKLVRIRCSSSFGVLVVCSLLGAHEALAGEPPTLWSGDPATECQVPTLTAYSTSVTGCSAGLIHPQIFVTAAHCLVDDPIVPVVWFGESVYEPTAEFVVEHCAIAPDYDPDPFIGWGTDLAYCKLDEPVLGLPIAPPAYGCELELLVSGTEILVAGFGQHASEQTGIKRWRVETLAKTIGPATDLAHVGTNTPVLCPGDSGSPALIHNPADDSWRTFAVAVSAPQPCGTPASSLYSLVHRYVPWIEESSGVDVTPCHDVDGTWNPTAECTGFAMDPLATDGTWAQMCSQTPISGPSASCGPAVDERPGDGDGDTTGGTEGEADSDSETGPHDESDSGTGDDTALDDVRGCSCRTTGNGEPWALVFGVFAPAAIRRRYAGVHKAR